MIIEAGKVSDDLIDVSAFDIFTFPVNFSEITVYQDHAKGEIFNRKCGCSSFF